MLLWQEPCAVEIVKYVEFVEYVESVKYVESVELGCDEELEGKLEGSVPSLQDTQQTEFLLLDSLVGKCFCD